MITSEQRKQIERMAYDAVKALTGEQLELKMIGYSDISSYGNATNYIIVEGKFEFEILNKELPYTYLMTMATSDFVTDLIRNY